MKRISVRQRVLGGALLVAAAYWAVDSFTGGEPTSAQAGPGLTSAGPAQWQDVAELIERLSRTDHSSVVEELDQLQRDLFQPTTMFAAALGSPETALAQQQAESAEQDRATAAAFADHHRLTGVILGNAPLAVIDGHLLPLNSDLDGFTLVEVRRASVVLAEVGTDRRVTLKLDQGPGIR